MPVVSAGSNQVGAIFTWIAHVIWPLGSAFWASAVLRRGQPCHATSPATLPMVPWRKRRRVRDVTTCEEFNIMPYLLRVNPLPGSTLASFNYAKCQYYK